MSAESYDVVVVGGGPAGSAAAYALASRGRRVCLIDKSNFPREKLCGGLITLRSKKIFESVFARKWKEDLFISSNDIDFYSDGKPLAHTTGYSTLFFTMRVDFDHYLLELARDAGAVLKLDSKISRLDLDANAVVLESSEQLNFQFLVGADGVNSQVARLLFGESFNPKTIGFGLEVEVPRERMPTQTDTVEIDFGSARSGYGWTFPKKRTFTLGVGGMHRLNPNLRDSLDRYVRRKGLDPGEFRVKGQYIPFGDFRKQPGTGNVLLCGDAAGVVDPITGEGIAYAMQSGNAAATAIVIAQSSAQAGTAQRLYRQEYRNIASSISQANFWRCLIFPAFMRRPFNWAFADAGTLQRGYLDILAGEHDYNALSRLFGRQTLKAIRKIAVTMKPTRRTGCCGLEPN
jgi:geranylgeranyl reductase family protein